MVAPTLARSGAERRELIIDGGPGGAGRAARARGRPQARTAWPAASAGGCVLVVHRPAAAGGRGRARRHARDPVRGAQVRDLHLQLAPLLRRSTATSHIARRVRRASGRVGRARRAAQPAPLRVPRPTRAAARRCSLLGMVAGAITGMRVGAKPRFALASEHVLAYLLLLPVAVANLDLDRRQLTRLLGRLRRCSRSSRRCSG